MNGCLEFLVTALMAIGFGFMSTGILLLLTLSVYRYGPFLLECLMGMTCLLFEQALYGLPSKMRDLQRAHKEESEKQSRASIGVYRRADDLRSHPSNVSVPRPTENDAALHLSRRVFTLLLMGCCTGLKDQLAKPCFPPPVLIYQR